MSEFANRMEEMNAAYARGFMFELFDTPEPWPQFRFISRHQFKDQVKAGMRDGKEFLKQEACQHGVNT